MGKRIIGCGSLPSELIKRVLGKDEPALPVYCVWTRMRHIEERHPLDVPHFHEAIASGIIQNPDYLGFKHGPFPGYSFVKTLDQSWKDKGNITVNKILVGVIFDSKFSNFYSVMTAYSIDDAVIASRIRNGLLKEVFPIQEPAPPPLIPVVGDIPTAAQLLAAQWGAKLRRADNRNSP